MTERWNDGKSSEILKDEMMERRNGGKSPEILKDRTKLSLLVMFNILLEYNIIYNIMLLEFSKILASFIYLKFERK